MEAVILKAINIFDNEDKSKLEQDKLVQSAEGHRSLAP